MATHIALLRGINVGAHKRIAMADLRALLAKLGYADARTLVQSGNIVFSSGATPEQLTSELEGAIVKQFGIDTPVIVRTREQLAAIVALNPLAELADQPKLYQVSFLAAVPKREALEKIAAVDVTPERFVHVGCELYSWHPNGIHNSPLARLLTDRQLGVVATARNWNTTVKLLEMANE